MTRAPLLSKRPCKFCPAKVFKKNLLKHLETHEEESYQKEVAAFHETQRIRAEIDKQIRLSTPKKKRA